MPFKSEEQRRYLWANEPEIARDWTDTYGSRIQKNNGGIMRIPFRSAGAVGAAHGSAAAAAGPVDRGNTGGDDKSYQTVQRPNPHIDISPTSQVTGPRIESSANEWIQNLNHLNAMRAAQQGTKFNPYQGGSRPQGGLLNPMGVMSLLGGFMKKPFSLAATGINAVRNKFGPAWKDWTAADNLAEFLRRRRTGETITNPAVRGEYGLPAINIDEEEEVDLPHYRPSIDYPFDWWNKNIQIWGDTTYPPRVNPHIEKTADWDSEEDVITGTNYPGEDIRTETILDRAKKLNTQIIDGDPESVLEKAKAINDRIKEKQREQEATEGAYYP